MTATLMPFGEFCVAVADEINKIDGPMDYPRGDFLVQSDFEYVEGAYAMACGPLEVAEDVVRRADDREEALLEDYDGQPDWAQEWEDFGEVYDDSYPLMEDF